MTKIVKVYGDAGTGKTTWCIHEMTNLLQNLGIEEQKIGYLTFSRTQANDAKKRIQQETGIHPKKNKSIGTIHSVCTRLLNIETEQYMKTKHKKQFCEEFGIEHLYRNINEKKEEIEQTEENEEYMGNALIQLYNYCLNFYAKEPSNLSDQEIIFVYEQTGIINKHSLHEMPYHRFFREYKNFKEKNDVYDFTDIIFTTYKEKLIPNIDFLFIDEIQDLGYLMQQILFNFMKAGTIKKIYLVGDEKQAIYRYLGANPKWFVQLKCDEEIVFSKTYRCPKKVWEIAKKIQNKMEDIKEREVMDNGEEGEFEIKEFSDFELVLNKLREIPKDKKVFVLGRTNDMWRSFSDFLSERKYLHQGLRHQTIFTNKLINLNNAIFKIISKKNLSLVEVDYLINTLPSSPFFVWGSKSKWKKTKEDSGLKTKYGKKEMQEIGFIFGLQDYWSEKNYLINNLNLKGESGAKQKDWLKDNCDCVLDEANVFLGTLHSSKGLDTDYVFLFTDSPFKLELNEGEKDLWYVGVTRAKKGVFCFSNLFDRSNSDNFEYCIS